MRESSKYIIITAAFISCTGSLYFLSLFFSLPIFFTGIILSGVVFFLYRWLFYVKAAICEPAVSGKKGWLSVLILLVGLFVIFGVMQRYTTKYGGWDAWIIWNFDARYLKDPENWRKLFQNVAYSHSDYPLCLPAVNAFFMRILSFDNSAVPFTLSTIIIFAVPTLIYQETAGRRVAAAIATLLVFASDQYYEEAGVSQYADTLVSFFFLCAFVCVGYITVHKKYAAFTTFFLASCAWSKNEGIILAVIFLLWYAPLFFSKRNGLYALAGLMLPLTALVTFKLSCGVQNDIVSKARPDMIGFLIQGSRYTALFSSYGSIISEKFMYTTAAICIYTILCIKARSAPGRNMYVMLTCIFAYSMIYIVTPLNQDWHLATSHSRLMLQLMPSILYIMATHSARMRFRRTDRIAPASA